jgi:hypothetical protein
MRIKENIVDLSKGLEVINALRPVEFDYITTGKHDVSFIAQEYEQVLPEQASETDAITEDIKELTNGEPLKQLNINLVPYLVKAIQELNAKIEAQLNESQGTEGLIPVNQVVEMQRGYSQGYLEMLSRQADYRK